jgi:hypothetical protein
MTDTMSADIVPIRETVPVRGKQGVSFPQETIDQAFGFFATTCGGDCSAVERMMTAKAEEGEAVPTARTIRNWAKAEDWARKTDELWRTGSKHIVWALRRKAVGNAILSQDTKCDAMTGGLDHLEPWQAAIRLKGSELSDRVTERIVGLINLEPPEAPREDDSHLSLQEREALANARLVEAMKRSIGRGE